MLCAAAGSAGTAAAGGGVGGGGPAPATGGGQGAPVASDRGPATLDVATAALEVGPVVLRLRHRAC